MGFYRFAASTPFAMIVTALVFMLMYGLIQQPEAPPEPEEKPRPTLVAPETVKPPPEEEPQPDDVLDGIRETNRPMVKPQPPTERPEPGTIGIPGGEPGPVVIGGTGLRGVNISGVPILTPAPLYPANCQARGEEGRVTVEFDVLGSGEVANARVVSASDRCFEKAALEAINNWRYQPALGREGEVLIEGNRQTFTFELVAE